MYCLSSEGLNFFKLSKSALFAFKFSNTKLCSLEHVRYFSSNKLKLKNIISLNTFNSIQSKLLIESYFYFLFKMSLMLSKVTGDSLLSFSRSHIFGSISISICSVLEPNICSSNFLLLLLLLKSNLDGKICYFKLKVKHLNNKLHTVLNKMN